MPAGLDFQARAAVREDDLSTIQNRIFAVSLLALASLILAGCPGRESIAAINRDPGRYKGKQITIAGRVTNSFGAVGTGVFEVDDGTGRIWVFSKGYGVPGQDATVAVTGTIEQGFTFGGRDYATILRETEPRR